MSTPHLPDHPHLPDDHERVAQHAGRVGQEAHDRPGKGRGDERGAMAELDEALRRLGGVPRLLVASDYDGVLAPIVTDPARAVPLPGAVDLLRRLAALPATTVAAVSGRARDDLAAVSGLPEAEITLVGSHGAEFTGQLRLDDEQHRLRERLAAELARLTDDRPGVRVEHKPASVVLHTRTAARDVAGEVTAAVLSGPASWPGVHVTTGKEVVELAVVATHKGTALQALRERVGANGVLFLGDDVTDENAFAVLHAVDAGVKVGPGPTVARYRVPDPPAAVRVLELMRDYRELHQDSRLTTPPGD